MIDGMTMTTSIDTTMVTTRDPKIFRQPNDTPEMGVEMCAKLETLSVWFALAHRDEPAKQMRWGEWNHVVHASCDLGDIHCHCRHPRILGYVMFWYIYINITLYYSVSLDIYIYSSRILRAWHHPSRPAVVYSPWPSGALRWQRLGRTASPGQDRNKMFGIVQSA